MKKLKNFALGFLIALLFTGVSIWLGYRTGVRNCNNTWQEIADSLGMVANMPPDTMVFHDTIWPAPDTIFIDRPIPKPIQIASDTNMYLDTLETVHFKVWLTDIIQGDLLERSYKYQMLAPLIIKDTIKIIINKPYPILKEVDPRSYWMVTAGAGGNYNGVGWSLGTMYLDKNNWSYGAEYLRLGTDGNVMLKIGYKF